MYVPKWPPSPSGPLRPQVARKMYVPKWLVPKWLFYVPKWLKNVRPQVALKNVRPQVALIPKWLSKNVRPQVALTKCNTEHKNTPPNIKVKLSFGSACSNCNNRKYTQYKSCYCRTKLVVVEIGKH